MRIGWMVFLAALLAGAGVVVADIAGTDANGKPVILRDDGTWAYTKNDLTQKCEAYAQNAVAQQRRNQDLSCGVTGSIWHLDNGRHFQWCMTVSSSQRYANTKSRADRLDQCALKHPQCQAYAQNAVAQQQRNLDLGCGHSGPNWHRDSGKHVQWCMLVDGQERYALTRSRADALANCQVTPPPPSTTYLGCFVDRNARDLVGSTFNGMSSAGMTTEYCVAECRRLGFAYAGTQYRNQCFCGNDYDSYGKAPEAECDLPCTGNPAQICGGTWRNSVFSTGLQVPVK